jgi:8-oxo-dGTP pyrophosphatase MutT (NUDIX family)/predicted metalloenzyme YecM
MQKVGVDNIILSEDRKILLIQRSPNSEKYPLCWGFIGGWMEDGELPIDALKREAKEEIGVETINHQQIGKVFSNIMTNGVTRLVIPHLAQIPENSKFIKQNEEVADIKWFSFEEALKLDWAYEHKDAFLFALESGIVDKYLAKDVVEIIGDWQNFLDEILKGLKNINIGVDEFELDHIAYRATNETSFISHCKMLESVAKLLHRNTIRNRFIDIYELFTPIRYDGRIIRYIELLAPAEGDKFNEGLEHAEFVITNIKLNEFVEKFPTLEWNTNAINRNIGADIGIKLSNGYGVKFITQTISEIIELEHMGINK